MDDELDIERGDEIEQYHQSDILALASMALEESKQEEKLTRKTDYSLYRDDALEPWDSIANEETLAFSVSELLKKLVLLPRGEVQYPLASAYLMLPSALCNRVPILYSQGQSGCGKSTLGYLAAKLHGALPISAGSTFASIRNTIATARLRNPKYPLDSVGNEKHAALIWEDISGSDLSGDDGRLFALLKNGIERSGTITIAELGGTNKTFPIFTPKYVSSIHPLYANHAFRELVRRIIVIQHKPLSLWLKSDYIGLDSLPDSGSLLDVHDIDFSGFHESFTEFWEDEDRLKEWGKISRSLARKKDHGMSPNDYRMSRDLICCGLVCCLWETANEACEALSGYWNWHRENIESQASATQKALSAFIERRVGELKKQNIEFANTGLHNFVQPLQIEASELKKQFDYLKSVGEIDSSGRWDDAVSAMASLGWSLQPNKGGVNSWQPITQ